MLLAVSFLTFIIGHDSGDPVLLLARGDATAAQKQQLRHALGLDRPVMAQYGSYLKGALEGDLGDSYRQRLPVSRLIALRLPASLLLAATAFALAMVLALLAGILCVVYRDGVLDKAVAGLAVLAQVVGQILFVVEADRTQRDEIEASLDLIQACPTITMVLNKQQISSRYTFGAYSSYYSS